jgi:phosphoserine phosphatase
MILRSDRVAFFDVDETLVMWSGAFRADEPGTIMVGTDSIQAYVRPHMRHIEEMKAHKARGHAVVVWSAGGHEWADAVVKSLGLLPYVDLVMSKPAWCYDDLKPHEFVGQVIYHKDEARQR